MPESRQRPGHHPHQESSIVPSSQRTKGRTVWAILVGVFGGVIAYFGAGPNYYIIAAGVIVGIVIGLVIGRKMEKDIR